MVVDYSVMKNDCFHNGNAETGCYDRNGEMLLVGDRVKVCGSDEEYGFIGKHHRDGYMLYFEGDNGKAVMIPLERYATENELEKDMEW